MELDEEDKAKPSKTPKGKGAPMGPEKVDPLTKAPKKRLTKLLFRDEDEDSQEADKEDHK